MEPEITITTPSEKWKKCGEEWSNFLCALLSPAVMALLLAAAALIKYSEESSGYVAVIFSIAASLASGLIGSILTRRWLEWNNANVIKARATLAVRSLRLLFGTIVSLEKRVRAFSANLTERDKTSLSATHYDEIVIQCVGLAEQVKSSIENWTDVVPEGSIKTEIGEITKLKEDLEKRSSEIDSLEAELKEKDKLSQDQQADLIKQLERKKEEILELKTRPMPSWDSSNYSPLSGVPLGATGPGGPFDTFRDVFGSSTDVSGDSSTDVEK